jgi:septum formation protein
MSGPARLWLGKAPLVLASRSEARRTLLASAAIPHEPVDSGLDERAFEARSLGDDADPGAVALALAEAKARTVSARLPGRLVLGADQTLSLEGRRCSKPRDRDEASAQIAAMSGKTHALHSGVAVVLDGELLFGEVVEARLSARELGPAFIAAYLEAAGDDVLQSVGAYRLEGVGIHLFREIVGDQSTIMGLPLPPLLAFLRRAGYLLD